MITVDDYFNEELECTYKGEVYSVRDNGAIMRHAREGKKVRKYDNEWTFGKTDEKSGYNRIGIESVHRIVAFAFLGEPPTTQHIVDHIDTNRQNNRPENLRWLTKLENVLKNPITIARIENICGSIEEFIKDPSILHGHEKIDPNFKWMRAVSPNEAKAAFENLTKWAKEKPAPKGGKLDEWVFHNQKGLLYKKMLDEMIKVAQKKEFDSKTPNVVQVKWRTPTEFPLCPQEQYSEPLEEYKKRLNPGEVFSRNYYNESIVVDAEFADDNDTLLVLCKGVYDGENAWYLVKVTYKDNLFYHKSIFAYFNEADAKEEFASIKEDIQILYDLEEYY